MCLSAQSYWDHPGWHWDYFWIHISWRPFLRKQPVFFSCPRSTFATGMAVFVFSSPSACSVCLHSPSLYLKERYHIFPCWFLHLFLFFYFSRAHKVKINLSFLLRHGCSNYIIFHFLNCQILNYGDQLRNLSARVQSLFCSTRTGQISESVCYRLHH